MSLVNDMLKDLDKRKRAPLSGGHSGVAIDYSGAANGNPFKLIGTVVIVGVLAGIAAAIILLSDPGQQPDVAGNVVNNAEQSPAQIQPVVSDSGTPEEAESAIRARIAGSRETVSGFELRIEVSEEVPFEIVSRTETQLQVVVRGIEEIGNTVSAINGLSLRPSPEGMLINLELDRAVDFLVYEDLAGELFVLTVEGFWLDYTGVENASEPAAEATQETVTTLIQENFADGSDASQVVPPIETSSAESSQPTRTARVLSLQDRDRNSGQQALRLAQDGQMLEAYNVLYNFINENPEAHQSRNSLATLLFAQQEYSQTNAVVEEGLALAPNHSGYKKIKARLLIRTEEYDAAIIMMNAQPPLLTDDSEYYELLASIYQQDGNHTVAIETFQELIRSESTVGRWWTGMAISHEALGNQNEALNSYQVALQTENLDARLRQYSQGRVRALSNQ